MKTKLFLLFLMFKSLGQAPQTYTTFQNFWFYAKRPNCFRVMRFLCYQKKYHSVRIIKKSIFLQKKIILTQSYIRFERVDLIKLI